ncbi:hypothetical protein TRFO_02548 [Tritrichomonas foetus]|uniref:Uncharacterized protein n=1 Tax=Tritrichomonas foetus TaxID=1144522 RepID=A0A1J4L668_9EUKA|nr:hypothetical protein TRFO_02548 [Tritrichomonas foetus]|eukprot:OHT17508.1 hypothetical protein TRFO_02548 [Tritrichomonas foetus]
MREGPASIHIRDFTVTDIPNARAPLGLTFGWFFIRILTTMPKDVVSVMKSNYGIEFRSCDMIQTGWFKMYLNESQVSYARSSKYLSLIPVKKYDKPNFKELKGQKQVLVAATKDWTPKGNGRVVSSMFEGLYVVEDADVNELFEDPRVVQIQKVPKVRAI